jgi:hypothetical protein
MSIIIKSGSSGNLANVDILGNLYVVASPAAIPSVAAPWTSATLINTIVGLVTTGGFEATTVAINQTSTITGGAVVFEGTYDGINWQAMPPGFILDPATFTMLPSTYTLQANTDAVFLVVTGSFQQTRVRLSVTISGTGSATIYSTLLSKNPENADGIVTVTNFPAQPNVFYTGQFTSAGNAVIWTPASGKSFRLQRYLVEVTQNASQLLQGVLTVSFQDGVTPMPFAHDVYVPSTGLRVFQPVSPGWIDLGSNGYLSLAPNNVLNVNLSSSLNAGNVRVIACGIEQ